MRLITILLLILMTLNAFCQSDTTAIKSLINSNFPDNTSNFITPARLRAVSLELMRSNANLAQENTFAESMLVEDSVKSDVGFYVWNGVTYEEISGGGDTANWAISGGFISPVDFTNKLNVDTARVGGNLYPDGTVNIGRSGAKFDTVFANVFDGVGDNLWQFSGDTLSPDLSYDYFSTSVIDGLTTASLLVGSFAGEVSSVFRNVSTQGTALIYTFKGYSAVSAPIVSITSTNYTKLTSDSLVIDGNAYAQDTVFASVIDKSYGEMGFRDSSFTLALDIDVPAWATNAENDIWQQAATNLSEVVYAGDSLVVNRTGMYHITGHISVAGSNGDVLRGYVYRNGTPLCLCAPISSLPNAKTVTLELSSNIASLTSGDVLKVYVENIGTSNDVALISGKVTVFRIN